MKISTIEYYENGPEGMPRVKRMSDSTLGWVAAPISLLQLFQAHPGGSEALNMFAHAVAEETLARLPDWPVAQANADRVDAEHRKVQRYTLYQGDYHGVLAPNDSGKWMLFDDAPALLESDTALFSFMAQHPEMHLTNYKGKWRYGVWSNYPCEVFDSPREAIRAASKTTAAPSDQENKA